MGMNCRRCFPRKKMINWVQQTVMLLSHPFAASENRCLTSLLQSSFRTGRELLRFHSEADMRRSSPSSLCLYGHFTIPRRDVADKPSKTRSFEADWNWQPRSAVTLQTEKRELNLHLGMSPSSLYFVILRWRAHGSEKRIWETKNFRRRAR